MNIQGSEDQPEVSARAQRRYARVRGHAREADASIFELSGPLMRLANLALFIWLTLRVARDPDFWNVAYEALSAAPIAYRHRGHTRSR